MKEISLHLLDLIENAVAAGARTVVIRIEEDREADRLRIAVRDDGRGMDTELARRATDPFATTRTTRKVGLGLPLLSAAAEQTGGSFSLWTRPGRGTRIAAEFGLSHIDRAPLGKLAETMATAAVLHPDTTFRFSHRVGRRHYRLMLQARSEQAPTEGKRTATDAELAREVVRRVVAGRRRIGSTA
ncbi:MAG: ATP-binding protein [Armatimonadota bacterium]